MEADWNLEETLGYVATWSAVTRMLEQGAREAVAAFTAALGARWGAPERRRRVSWPLALRAGYAD
jgi:hypothetical protein